MTPHAVALLNAPKIATRMCTHRANGGKWNLPAGTCFVCVTDVLEEVVRKDREGKALGMHFPMPVKTKIIVVRKTRPHISDEQRKYALAKWNAKLAAEVKLARQTC